MRYVWLVFVLVLVSVSSFAQGSEPYWRVDAERSQAGIPAYQGQKSPFPFVAPPVVESVEVKTPEPVYDPELIEQEARNKKAAEILAEIRGILVSETAFNPDLSAISVSGIIRSDSSTSALIDNKWVRSGQQLEVPVQAVDRLVSLVAYLESLSPELSRSIQEKIDEKLLQMGDFKVRLDRIEKGSVVFKDNRNKTYVILFEGIS